MDDALYDVETIEARLAQMKCERLKSREISKISTEDLMRERVQNSCTARVMTDFELSAIDDSSDDDELEVSTSSASSEEGLDQLMMSKGVKTRNKLKDSLDLSMSVAPTIQIKTTHEPTVHKQTKKEVLIKNSSQIIIPTPVVAPVDEVRNEEAWVGRLVQRRRELERQATENTISSAHESVKALSSPPLIPSEKPSHVTNVMGSESRVATTKSTLQAPISRIPRPESHLHRPEPPQSNRPNHQPQDINPSMLRGISNVDDLKTSRPGGNIVGNVERPVVGNPINRIHAETTVVTPLVRGTTMPASPPKVVTQPTSDKGNRIHVQTMKPADAAPNPVVAKSITSSKVSVPIMISRGSYARSMPPSNVGKAPQAHSDVTIQPVIKSAPQPESLDEVDIIDDLLVAEELKLRQSLENLNSRLKTISTNRITPPNTNQSLEDQSSKVKVPYTNSSKKKQYDPEREYDEDDYVRSVRGNRHNGHQQLSPSERASHTRRSELSSGIHKPRARPGPTVAPTGVPDLKGDKVVVKKDLAHLLF